MCVRVAPAGREGEIGEGAFRFAYDGIPYTAILSPRGIVLDRESGALAKGNDVWMPAYEQKLRAALERLAGEKNELAALEDAVQREPRDAEALAALLAFTSLTRRRERAAEALDSLLALEPGDPSGRCRAAWLDLLAIFQEAGDPARTVDLARRFLVTYREGGDRADAAYRFARARHDGFLADPRQGAARAKEERAVRMDLESFLAEYPGHDRAREIRELLASLGAGGR
ncbi:MAG: hypothetical protein HY720_16760 [Planctomycetes bacterium]|nr:hypothetical protein [Planctomycetota bacterium]